MKHILVIGASGFVGKHLVKALLTEKYHVRALARNPDKVKDLAQLGSEIVKADISNRDSLNPAFEDIDAVYVSVHTLSPQHTSTADKGFMEVEFKGIQNIVEASKSHGVTRLIYVTSLGVAADSPSEWTRERWKVQEYLFQSGLDVTVLQPGQIVGSGGNGFDMMVKQANKTTAVMLANGKQRWRTIAVDDLVYYLVGVLDEPRMFGQSYEVGADDILTNDQMVDVIADVLGRKHPRKLHIPRGLIRRASPLIERSAKMPRGSMRGLVDSMDTDAIGDPSKIRAILPRPPMPYRKAVEVALGTNHAS